MAQGDHKWTGERFDLGNYYSGDDEEDEEAVGGAAAEKERPATGLCLSVGNTSHYQGR